MYFELVILKCYETDVYLSSVHGGGGVTGLNFFLFLREFSEVITANVTDMGSRATAACSC